MLTCFVLLTGFLLAAATVAGLVFYLYRHYSEQWESERRDFKSAVVERLRGKRDTAFDFLTFADECQVSRSTAAQVAEEIYGQLFAKVVDDGILTDDERAKLDRLARKLALAPHDAAVIEEEIKARKYTTAVDRALADGTITEAEKVELELLRKNLGLAPKRAFDFVAQPAMDGYVALVRSIVSDGRITDEEWEELHRYRQALGMSELQAQGLMRPHAGKVYSAVYAQIARDGEISGEEHEQLQRFRKILGLSDGDAKDLVRSQAIDIYRQVFYEIQQDGEVSEDDERRLSLLQRNLSLSDVDVSDYQAQLADTKRLAALRNGRLPSIQTSRFLESGELCHWIGACVFVWQTSTKSKNARGELIVTSERIIFTSPNKSFEFTPSKIVDIQAFTNAVVLASSGSKGAGTYLIEDAAILEAVLVGVVRKHKYLASESFSSSKTRHIPDSVKREVWFRDGGKCVRCESQQYLEFDHIIPHAKGGANTVNNVQLLCRACNALKSDRI